MKEVVSRKEGLANHKIAFVHVHIVMDTRLEETLIINELAVQ